MHSEISFAVAFVVRMLGKGVSDEARRLFSASLTVVLQDHFRQAAWDPQRPMVGSAFRCVRSESGRIDPLLARAATRAGVPPSELPSSLTLWVDPGDVSARIGSEGSLFSVLEGSPGYVAPVSPGKLSPTTPTRGRGLLITDRPSPKNQQQQQQQQQQDYRIPVVALA